MANLRKLISRINGDFQLALGEKELETLEFGWSKSLGSEFEWDEDFYKRLLQICKQEFVRRPTIIQVLKANEAGEKPRYFQFKESMPSRDRNCETCNGTGIKLLKEAGKILGFRYLEKDGVKIPERCEC